jgi:hypothetical protein
MKDRSEAARPCVQALQLLPQGRDHHALADESESLRGYVIIGAPLRSMQSATSSGVCSHSVYSTGRGEPALSAAELVFGRARWTALPVERRPALHVMPGGRRSPRNFRLTPVRERGAHSFLPPTGTSVELKPWHFGERTTFVRKGMSCSYQTHEQGPRLRDRGGHPRRKSAPMFIRR